MAVYSGNQTKHAGTLLRQNTGFLTSRGNGNIYTAILLEVKNMHFVRF